MGKLAPHPALRATFPRRGRLFALMVPPYTAAAGGTATGTEAAAGGARPAKAAGRTAAACTAAAAKAAATAAGSSHNKPSSLCINLYSTFFSMTVIVTFYNEMTDS